MRSHHRSRHLNRRCQPNSYQPSHPVRSYPAWFANTPRARKRVERANTELAFIIRRLGLRCRFRAVFQLANARTTSPQQRANERCRERRIIMSEYMCYAELAVGIIGIVVAIWSEVKRRRSEAKRRQEREWIHMSLVSLKPSIQGPNQTAVIAAINNMLEFLKPSPRKE